MNIKKRGLGRGLNDLGINALLSDIQQPMTDAANKEWRYLAVELLEPGQFQPRRDFSFDALQELADSIRAQGIIQPLVVRPIANGRYEIIAGERRWRAAQLAGLSEVPVLIRELSDEAALAVGLIENIQREDLNAIEEATALQRLLSEFNMTHEQVAQAVGKSRAMVTNLLRLLSLPDKVQRMVVHGELSMGHARALLSVTPEQQLHLAQEIVEKNLSVRETEKLVNNPLQAIPKPEKPASTLLAPELEQLRLALAAKLDMKTKLKPSQRSNGGKLILHYRSVQELENLLMKISEF